MCLLSCPIESAGGWKLLESRWSVQYGWSQSSGFLCSGRTSCWDFVCSDWLAELFDIPETHHAIVGEWSNVVGQLSADDTQGVNRILVGVCWDTQSLNGHGLDSDIPHEELAIIASTNDGVVGKGEKLGRSYCWLREAIELGSVFQGWIPQ